MQRNMEKKRENTEQNLETQGYDSTNRGKEGGGEGGPPVAGGLRPPEAYPAAVVT